MASIFSQFDVCVCALYMNITFSITQLDFTSLLLFINLLTFSKKVMLRLLPHTQHLYILQITEEMSEIEENEINLYYMASGKDLL